MEINDEMIGNELLVSYKYNSTYCVVGAGINIVCSVGTVVKGSHNFDHQSSQADYEY